MTRTHERAGRGPHEADAQWPTRPAHFPADPLTAADRALIDALKMSTRAIAALTIQYGKGWISRGARARAA